MNRIHRPFLFALVLVGLLIVGTHVVARAGTDDGMPGGKSRAYLHAYNLPSTGVAIEGYCPVSYHLAGKPVQGKPEYTSNHNGVTYRFASADGKRLFDANPEKYLPAYGGWCAFGMAIEDKFPVDPTAFKIVDGRLMLFLRNQNVDALALWNDSDEQVQVDKADAHWNTVRK